jgi:hypothetical protein
MPQALKKLRLRAAQELGHDIPQQYADFLAITDGLDWNGLVVYASERTPIVGYSDRFIEGFVEGNLNYRDFEPMNGFLVFADDGVALYAYCISARQFQVILSVGLSVLKSFPTFDELLASAFQDHV